MYHNYNWFVKHSAMTMLHHKFLNVQAPVVWRSENTTHWIAIYLLDSIIRPLYDWAQVISNAIRITLTSIVTV